MGHWVLHRYNYKNWKFNARYAESGDLEDDEKSLCRLDEKSPRDWLEFHANVFAACLIMPQDMFINALTVVQKSIGISKNIGRIFLSNTSYSLKDCEKTIEELANIFQVSNQSVRVRVKTLKLVVLQSPDAGKGFWHSCYSH